MTQKSYVLLKNEKNLPPEDRHNNSHSRLHHFLSFVKGFCGLPRLSTCLSKCLSNSSIWVLSKGASYLQAPQRSKSPWSHHWTQKRQCETQQSWCCWRSAPECLLALYHRIAGGEGHQLPSHSGPRRHSTCHRDTGVLFPESSPLLEICCNLNKTQLFWPYTKRFGSGS